jgi:hypothetical protein
MGRPKGSTNKTKKTVTENPAPENTVTPEAPASGEIVTRPVTENDTPSEIVVSGPKREAALSIVGGVTTEQLKQALVVQTEQRKLIQEFIKENLFVDIDYGKIHVVKNCREEDQARGSCTKDYHFSKSILFKPGQEKIFSLFGISDELEKDLEAYEMLGNAPGLVAYKCIMYRGENRIGEGRGAATLGANQNDPNSTIKKAEKRARMDACLSLGFSAYFTQDLDDPEYKSQREMMNERAKNEAERIDKDEFGLMPRDPEAAIDAQERPLLFNMILKYGVDKYYVIDSLKLNGIEKPEAMTSGQARHLMGLIKSGVFKKPEQPEIPTDPEIIPDSQLPEDNYRPAPKVQEAELEVDEDLQEHVRTEFETIGFNARGKMWFMKFVAGKPFGAFEKFTDNEWRRAYQHILDINDLKVDLPVDYLEAGPAAPAPQTDVDKVAAIMGGEVITTADGSKVIKATGEVVDDEENQLPDDLR